MLTRARDNVGGPSVVLLLLLALAPLFVRDVTSQGILILAMIYAVGAVGLDLLTGYSGQFSFGQFVYYAIGAYVMTTLRLNEHWGWVPALIAGVAAAGVVATVIGGIFVRLKFFGSAVGTFFLGAVAVDLLSGKRLSHWTGGSNGLTVPPVSVGSRNLTDGNGLYYASFIALAIAVVLCLRYTKVRAGMAARVVKENEVVSAVLGVRVFREKVRTQAVAGALAGLGGCLLALDIGYLSPETFNVSQSIEMFAIVAVGGTGSLAGPILGSIFFFSLTSGLADTSASASKFLFSAVLLAVVVLFNRGLYDLVEQAVRFLWCTASRWAGRPAATLTLPRPPWLRARRPAQTGPARTGPAPPTPKPVSESVVRVRDESAPIRLAVEGASVDFGGVKALDDVRIDVRHGDVHAIIGPNGAGKTTLLNCVSGIQPMAGRVTLDGADLSRSTVSQRRALGISRTFQHPALVSDLTVVQNVEVGAFETHDGSVVLELLGLRTARRRFRVARERAERALELLAFPRERWHMPAGDLTMGEQKQVDIARAMANEPKVLLLDEPTSGLGPEEMASVARAIETVRAAGVTVLVIAHHVGFIRQIADHCTVLDFGKVLAGGTAADVLASERVVEVFVGAGAKA